MKVEGRWTGVSKFLGVLFMLVLVGLLAVDFWREGVFNQNLGLNLLVVGERSVGLLSLRPKEKSIQWLRFPADLKTKVYNSGASYPLTSLWEYGKSEHNQYVVTEKSVGNMLGVAIARTIKVKGEATLERVLESFTSWGVSTDLSLRDRLVMHGMISEAILSKKVIELEMPTAAITKVTEPDGKEFWIMNEVAMVWLKDKFYFESIMAENVEVIVNNVSGVAGMGNLMARQLETAGMKVLEVKNDESDLVENQGCFYLVESGDFEMSIEYLEKQLDCRLLGSGDQKKTERGLMKVWLR